MSDSIAFDRAADYYDRTRGLSGAAAAAQTELLVRELRGRGRALEVGVGTGQVALPLASEGIPLLGVDLSRPMVDRLLANAGGAAPFPLVLADAARLPLGDDAFGAALTRWVLHLIPDWTAAVGEMARTVHPGGVLLISLGGYGSPRREIQNRFGELAGVSVRPIGLDWDGWAELDVVLASLGASARALPEIPDHPEERMGSFLAAIGSNRYSWTWPVPEDVRLRAVRELRGWVQERFGPLDRPRRSEHPIRWRAYDLP